MGFPPFFFFVVVVFFVGFGLVFNSSIGFELILFFYM